MVLCRFIRIFVLEFIIRNNIMPEFDINPNAMEVLVYKGNKSILLKRTSVESRDFFKTFVKRYNK